MQQKASLEVRESESLARVGGWLTKDYEAVEKWLASLMLEVFKEELTHLRKEELEKLENALLKNADPVIKAFQECIETTPELYMYFTQMFTQVPKFGKFKKSPMGLPQIQNYKQMLILINHILTQAPKFSTKDLVGFPINAILDWSMGTAAGFSAFLNKEVNKHFKAILNKWCAFLNTPASCSTLNEAPDGWFSKEAIEKTHLYEFELKEHEPYLGFCSWNDFFTRKFKPDMRPIAGVDDDAVIISACESQPYKISTNVQKESKFWIKSQPYALKYMLDNDEHVDTFVGGTVYQAFLSAYKYHCWHAPVSGTIKKVKLVEGTYYSEAHSEHFDPAGPNNSQGYITQVAARMLIFIESDNPNIGLMCFMAVGMAEVSSCVASVKEGDKVKKGDLIGYFQFGGSTHCLIFQKDVIEQFSTQALPDFGQAVHVNSHIATAKRS